MRWHFTLWGESCEWLRGGLREEMTQVERGSCVASFFFFFFAHVSAAWAFMLCRHQQGWQLLHLPVQASPGSSYQQEAKVLLSSCSPAIVLVFILATLPREPSFSDLPPPPKCPNPTRVLIPSSGYCSDRGPHWVPSKTQHLGCVVFGDNRQEDAGIEM